KAMHKEEDYGTEAAPAEKPAVYAEVGSAHVEAELELNDDELLGSSTLAKIGGGKSTAEVDSEVVHSDNEV
ncbi:MAG: hypothetical protein ABFD14_11395, partial [Anaerolineaceae bacterium]